MKICKIGYKTSALRNQIISKEEERKLITQFQFEIWTKFSINLKVWEFCEYINEICLKLKKRLMRLKKPQKWWSLPSLFRQINKHRKLPTFRSTINFLLNIISVPLLYTHWHNSSLDCVMRKFWLIRILLLVKIAVMRFSKLWLPTRKQLKLSDFW